MSEIGRTRRFNHTWWVCVAGDSLAQSAPGNPALLSIPGTGGVSRAAPPQRHRLRVCSTPSKPGSSPSAGKASLCMAGDGPCPREAQGLSGRCSAQMGSNKSVGVSQDERAPHWAEACEQGLGGVDRGEESPCPALGVSACPSLLSSCLLAVILQTLSLGPLPRSPSVVASFNVAPAPHVCPSTHPQSELTHTLSLQHQLQPNPRPWCDSCWHSPLECSRTLRCNRPSLRTAGCSS